MNKRKTAAILVIWLGGLGAAACGYSKGTPSTTSSAGSSATTLPSQVSAGAAARAGTAAPIITTTPPLARPSQPSAAGTSGGSTTAMLPGTTGALPGQAGAGAAPSNTPPLNMMPAANSGGTPPPITPPADGSWPAADPAKMGPFATATEMMVGPGMAYTMVRPKDLMRRHPVITWGNGTGTTPMVYTSLLNLYASHGFIVIASNSENVAQGTPPPMLDGVTWVLEQDMTMGSSLFEHVDREHIGATGHSQGAFAASSCGSDARIQTIAPIETLGAGPGLHGPALGLCGTMDTTVPCSGNMRSFTAITNQPVMYAEFKAADHTNWIFSPSGPHPYAVMTNAWFRVHLMGDTALRPMFYGADCTYCKDDAWVIMRKMMDN